MSEPSVKIRPRLGDPGPLESKARFLRDPERCPYCKSHEVTVSVELEGGVNPMTSKVYYLPKWADKFTRRISTKDTCESCGREWREIYHMIDVEFEGNYRDEVA